MARRPHRDFMGAALAAMAIAGTPSQASAQVAQNREISVSIAPQSLSDALRSLASASGLQLIYDTKITSGRTSPAISGTMTSQEALTRLLAGSGLTFSYSGDRTVVISPSSAASAAGPADGARAVGVVNVDGVSGSMPFGEMISPVNGTNGSKDVEATEGTGSYTTGATSIASKIPMTIKDTPQSVSVITRQQIQDQELVSIRDITERLPGTAIASGANTEEFRLFSRGFAVENVAIDGGAPLTFSYNNRPVIDMSEFDSVQLVRGANGLFGGYGDPGGTLNLERKKPLDHRQIAYEQDVGEYRTFREQVDVTGPLTRNRKLRVRIVGSRQDRHYFYDIANSHKTSLYGVLEYDLTPRTLLTAGASYNRENNVPNQLGLPRYANGDPIDFPRSTCLCVPFAYDRATRKEAFVGVTHNFSDNVTSRLNFTYSRQNVAGLYYGASGLIYKGGIAQSNLGGFASTNPLKLFSFDGFTSAKFRLFGQDQSLVVGGNYSIADNTGGATYYLPTISVPDIFHFNPSAYTKPMLPAPAYFALVNKSKSLGLYANLRLSVTRRLHLLAGIRYNSLNANSTYQYDYTTVLDVKPTLRDRTLSRPSLGITYDVTDNLTAYANYQTSYRPQIYATGVKADFTPPPIIGLNEEAGLKWQSSDKRLNAALSVYRIKQSGFLQQDYDHPGQYSPYPLSFQSRGFEAELAGQLSHNLQASFSYSYNDSKQTAYGNTSRQASFNPRHLFKSWLTYRAPSEGRLSGLIVGGGVNYQSASFTSGYVCTQVITDPNQYCDFSAYAPYQYSTKPYALLSAKIGYTLNKHVEVALKVDNLTNVFTYASNAQQNVFSYNYYLAPRSFLLSLKAKW